MPFPAKAVANEFLAIAEEEGRGISPLKLQKLIYFANGWNFAFKNEPLINERFQAWQYGPVIPEIYQEFKRFGNDPIQGLATDVDLEDRSLVVTTPRLEDYDDAEDPQTLEFSKQLIRKVWQEYSHFPATALSEATHRQGTPWAQVFDQQRYKVIPDKLITAYFTNMMQKNEPITVTR